MQANRSTLYRGWWISSTTNNDATGRLVEWHCLFVPLSGWKCIPSKGCQTLYLYQNSGSFHCGFAIPGCASNCEIYMVEVKRQVGVILLFAAYPPHLIAGRETIGISSDCCDIYVPNRERNRNLNEIEWSHNLHSPCLEIYIYILMRGSWLTVEESGTRRCECPTHMYMNTYHHVGPQLEICNDTTQVNGEVARIGVH